MNISDADIDKIARAYFADEYFQNQMKSAIHDVFKAAGLDQLEQDAAAFRTIAEHCGEMKIAFRRDNQVRQLTFVVKASTMTSDRYQEEIRSNVEALAKTGALWPRVEE